MSTSKILPPLILSIVVAAIAWGFARTSSAADAFTMQDYLDIQQNYTRYFRAEDSNDGEAWVKTFTADGLFNGTPVSKALVASKRPTDPKSNPLRHWSGNLTIVPTAEGANVSIYQMSINITTKPASINTYSRYDDTFVKTPQGWRFKKRQRSSDTTIDAAGR